MSFIYPLGLIGLIGVPILILIYILRSKYNEQTVPSTYLWILSEKFFKRRNPFSGMTGIISLILQILMVIFASLAIARPIFTVPESASEYCFILDDSGSMNTLDGDETYFEKGKTEIEDMIDAANLGSSYTLISLAGDTPTVYERLTDKKIAKEMLRDLQCTDGTVDASQALYKVQKYFEENNSLVTYFVTDKNYKVAKNVNIVNVSLQKAENCSIDNAWGNLTDGKLYTGATVHSHTNDTSITVELYVNGSDKVASRKSISLKAGESADVELSCTASGYDSFRLVIVEDDDLPIDNEVVLYNLNSEAVYSILIVSETPFFYEAAFDAVTDSRVDVVTPEEYTGQSGYGLYVFHSFAPESLPDASVWLINVNEGIENSGFGSRGIVKLDYPTKIVKSTSTSTRARQLLSGVEGRDIFVSEYVKYSGMYTQFTTLFSHEGNPLIFAGVNAFGNREVVFGFDIHNTDMALSTDFVPLISNLLNYSCPSIVDSASYICGEELQVNVTANVESVKVVSPDGEETYVDTSSDVGTTVLDRVGTYTVEVVASDGEKTYKIYSSAPVEESKVGAEGEDFSVIGEAGNERTDGQYDPIVLLFVLLAIVFTADWMVYCYEKYQLR